MLKNLHYESVSDLKKPHREQEYYWRTTYIYRARAAVVSTISSFDGVQLKKRRRQGSYLGDLMDH